VKTQMDGTWHLHHKEIKYGICSFCGRLVDERELIKNGKELSCHICAGVE